MMSCCEAMVSCCTWMVWASDAMMSSYRVIKDADIGSGLLLSEVGDGGEKE